LKVADTDKTASSQDPIERAGKLLPLLLAALYLTGFMVVALHLAGYGASSLDLFKIQYLAAGIWFGFILILFFGIEILLRVFLGSFLDGLSPKGGFLRFSNYETLKDWFATTVICLLWFAGLLIVIVLAGKSKPGGGVIPFLYDCRYLLLSLVGLDICVRLLLIFRRKQHRSSETEDEINERLSRVPGAVFAEWGFNYLKVLMAVTSVGLFFLVSTGLFASKVYPRIWFSLGGGQARQVVFWLGPVSGIASDSVLERDCSNPEYTVTYELLLENENSLVVISPKGGQKAIVFDRKAVGAVILLGERPSYAPANYRRAVSEAPVSGQKCQNP
jgi:hypothetical protein